MIGKIPKEIYAALKEFGLTDYESRALIALVINGVSTAKEISDRTQIPYSRIYDILLNLEKINFVKVLQGRPMQYKSERPVTIAKIAKEQLEEKYKRIETALIDQLEPLYGNEKEIDTTPIFLIKGNWFRRITDLINNSKKNVHLLFSNPAEEMLEKLFEHILNASTRKVEIEIIIPEKYTPKDKKIWRKLLTISKIKIVSRIMFDGILVDKEELIIFLSSFFNIRVPEENMVFWISEKRLIDYTSTYFRYIWGLGKPFSLKNYA